MAAVDFTKLTPEELDAVLEMPAMAPPANEVSNFTNPPNLNPMAVAIMSICVVVVVVCLLARGYARLILQKKVQVQEYLILTAFACFLGWVYCTMKLVESPGYYVHTWNVKLRQTVDMGLLVHVAGVFYSVCLPLLKSSILVEWIGVFVPGTRNWFFWVSWTLVGLQVAFAIAAVVALNLACIPTQKKWEFWLPGKCINAHDIETVSASFQLASDCAILILPQKAIWSLNMGWKKKLGVSVIFSLGLFACISAAFRLVVTIQYAAAQDAIYYIGPVCFWAYAEMTCGFIVVCVPCIPKILLESGVWRQIQKTFGLSVTGKSGATGGTGGTSGSSRNRAGSSAKRSKNIRSVNNSYLEIDDTELKTFQSESTEHLRDPIDPHAKLDKGIVRTMQVTQDSTNSNSQETVYDHRTQKSWR
ncbi:60s ribosomal protein l36 [Colletotrichum truncatum]|uniref:60s ribosomal protein l36 n=1 Tax=Colletotrichum truncatum TaxID=5467 RepID=A0ACC3Z8G4_COLTU|nr:60s ribosomal protein l36 [Colletotrichum truncatum]KAF6789200.1 60s ribosomal protein l36 [Colletotrichum truncatum]